MDKTEEEEEGEEGKRQNEEQETPGTCLEKKKKWDSVPSCPRISVYRSSGTLGSSMIKVLC